jgi:chromosomal replication initiator protein
MHSLFSSNDLKLEPQKNLPSPADVPDMPATRVWPIIKSDLHSVLPVEDFQYWIEPLSGVVKSAKEIIVSVPNLVFYQSLEGRLFRSIEESKLRLGFASFNLRFEIESQADAFQLTQEIDSYEDAMKNDKTTPTPQERSSIKVNENNGFSKSLSHEANINRNYVFDSFVKGDSNQFAVATCMSAAENPGKAYNPLFIYGSTGLGKTHLLHAVGNRLLELNPNAVVTYIPSERFMNELIYCLRFNKMWDFRQKYRNCDVFLVDDIQFIASKKATQEEFFHTFNTLYAAKKQIVITSDLFPKDIPEIEDRLRNRFQWGLIADIQPPSIEHRIAILLSKAEKLGVRLDENVAEYVAKHAKRNVRELEGALHRIAAFATLHGQHITLDLAINTFKDVLGEPPRRITVENIQKQVAEHFKLRVSDLKSKRRQRAYAHPRQIAMYLTRKLTTSSFPEIGEKFGGKDHTTVMHNVKKIAKTLEKDLDLKAHVESLERKLEHLQ